MRERIAILFVTLALTLGVGASFVSDEALTDEDIVRLFVQGRGETELIELIAGSEVDFDLAEEMLEELRIAGIPAAVIAAMRKRQIEMEPAHEETAAAAEALQPRLIVRLNPEADEPKRLQLYDQLDKKVAAKLELRSSEPTITDLGIVLLCRTGDHVPDHWRSKSPLGRDFVGTPRHRLLAFITGATSTPAGKVRNLVNKLGMVPGQRAALPDLQVLELTVPPTIEVELEAGVAHDLTLGIALQIDGRFYLALSDRRDGLLLEDQGATTVSAELRGSSKNPMRATVSYLPPDGGR